MVAGIQENIMELNQNRTPTHYIKDYAVFEHLGSGAFGSVYKVRKRGGQTFQALKEVGTTFRKYHKPFHPEFIQWTFPSLNLDMSIIANRGVSKNQTEWQTV